ncbi:MAG: protein kinase, partial [Myxococcales bacterium]|nr:protein kinase [Myxococcales bacterium]
GMGVVYEAEHEDIERRVALKILRPEASLDATLKERFRAEARAASRIGSPHIVEIFDFGELPDGRLLFAMELLEGKGLDVALERGPLDPSRAIGILRQICKGLAAAHEADIVHRDVKPDNVILVAADDGRPDFAKLVDFGIATVMAQEGDDTGAGTPLYMPPEQINGEAFDGRLDMYAVGCLAYELLVGAPPFGGETVDEIITAQLESAPPSIVNQRPDVPVALEAVVLRCIAKAPRDRYADMHDLEAALCEAQIESELATPWDDLPLPRVTGERLDRLRRQMPQHAAPEPQRRWVWPAIAAVSMAIAIVVTILLLTSKPEVTPEQENVVETLTNKAREYGAKANWVFPPESDKSATALIQVLALENLEDASTELALERAGALRREFATTLIGLGNKYWADAEGKAYARDYYAQAYLFNPENPTIRERSGYTVGELAELREKAKSKQFSAREVKQGRLFSALAETDEGKRAELVQEIVDSDELLSASNGDRLMALAGGGRKATRRRKPDARESDSGDGDDDDDGATSRPQPKTTSDPQADRRQREANKARSRELAKEGLSALGKRKYRNAEQLFNRALDLDSRNTTALIGLSDLNFEEQKFSRAIDFAERAIKVAPRNGGYRIKLGDAYFKVLKYSKAREHYERALELGHRDAAQRIKKVKDKTGK